jgi:lipid A 3-O-deacylase
MTRSPLLAAGALLLLAAAAQAQPALQGTLPPADPRAVFHLLTENDSYNLSNPRTDRWYTNGIRLGWQSAENNLPDFMRGLDNALAGVFGPANSRWGFGIGQEIFTPVNKRLFDPDPRDRPYAGYLHANLTLDRRTWTTLDRFEVQAGIIGPSSLGRQAQDLVHGILGERRARGWRYELHDEPVFNVNAERIWRLPLAQLPGGFGMDALPSVGAQLGTVRIAASAGARLRIGQGLDRDFGVPRIRPAIADAPAPVGEGFGWYLFGGVGGNAVARDIFLDGNTYRDSRSVDLRPFTGDAEAGAAVFWHNIRLSYTQVWRSKEFVAQPKPFTFGAFSLSFAF